MGRLTEAPVAFQVRCFERDWRSARVVGVAEPLIRRAGELAHIHALRGYDSVHLAAAEEIHRLVGGQAPFRFAAFDVVLTAAARGLGVPLLED